MENFFCSLSSHLQTASYVECCWPDADSVLLLDRLAQHEQQLAMVDEALSVDPDRADLLELKSELENIIQLLREYTKTEQPGEPASKSTTSSSDDHASPSHTQQFQTGQNVLARYAADGLFYPARVTRVSSPWYTVLFDGYGNTEQVKAEDLRLAEALSASHPKSVSTTSSVSGNSSASPMPATGPSTPVVGEIVRPSKKKEEEAEAERRKRRSEKKRDRLENKKVEAEKKQSSWQKFATKGAKKGYAIAGAKGKSMFRTPDDPTAKVGVVGAGRGMTTNSQRQKHNHDTLG